MAPKNVLQLVPLEGRRAPSAEGLPSATRNAPDETLVACVIAGDRDAFEALYRRHAAFAINLTVRLQGNRIDVEDLVHDAFLKAHQQMSELRDAKAFRGWLGSIIVSQVRTRLRRARWFKDLGLSGLFGSNERGRDSVDMDSLAAPGAGPDMRAELAQVYALLRLLPADERIAWTLRSVERHKLDVVAEMTQCSLATVKRRILRAQRFLDEHFVSADASIGDAKAGGTGGAMASEAPPRCAGDEDPAQSTRLPRRGRKAL